MYCSPVAIVIADTAPYFRLVFWLLLPWDLHLSLSSSLSIPAVFLPPHLCFCTPPCLTIPPSQLLSCISVTLSFCQNQIGLFLVLLNLHNDRTLASCLLIDLSTEQHVCVLSESRQTSNFNRLHIITLSRAAEELFLHKGKHVLWLELIYRGSVSVDWSGVKYSV